MWWETRAQEAVLGHSLCDFWVFAGNVAAVTQQPASSSTRQPVWILKISILMVLPGDLS